MILNRAYQIVLLVSAMNGLNNQGLSAQAEKQWGIYAGLNATHLVETAPIPLYCQECLSYFYDI